jgi:hypothetical protein
MAQTTVKKAPVARKRTPAKKTTTIQPRPALDRTADLSENVLRNVEGAQRAAIEAVRKFVDTVDEALPAMGEHPSRREHVIDAALDMADKLVTTQYEFLRGVVRSAAAR